MKKEISPSEGAARSADKNETRGKKSRRLPSLPAPVRAWMGPKPVIHFGHLTARKIFERFGLRFEVRRFGESRLGLLRWPLRKLSPGETPRRLVLVPGFGDTPLSWWSILAGLRPVLTKKADEVILVDFPGYGGFLHAEPAFDSMDELLRVFREVVASLDPEVLIGHSLGGWLSADYAIEQGERLKELYLVDPGGLVGTEAEKAAYRSIFANAIDLDGEGGLEELLSHCFAKAPALLPFFQEEFFSFLRNDEIRSFVGSFEDRHLLNDRIEKIRAQTTVIWGEFDTMTPTKWIDLWQEGLSPEARRGGVVLKGSGHSPQIEKPGALIALFTQLFLQNRVRKLPMDFLWRTVGDLGKRPE